MNQAVVANHETQPEHSIVVHCFLTIQQALVGKTTAVKAFECLKSLESIFTDEEGIDFYEAGCNGYKAGWYWEMLDANDNIEMVGPYLTKSAAQIDYDYYKALL